MGYIRESGSDGSTGSRNVRAGVATAGYGRPDGSLTVAVGCAGVLRVELECVEHVRGDGCRG